MIICTWFDVFRPYLVNILLHHSVYYPSSAPTYQINSCRRCRSEHGSPGFNSCRLSSRSSELLNIGSVDRQAKVQVWALTGCQSVPRASGHSLTRALLSNVAVGSPVINPQSIAHHEGVSFMTCLPTMSSCQRDFQNLERDIEDR